MSLLSKSHIVQSRAINPFVARVSLRIGLESPNMGKLDDFIHVPGDQMKEFLFIDVASVAAPRQVVLEVVALSTGDSVPLQ